MLTSRGSRSRRFRRVSRESGIQQMSLATPDKLEAVASRRFPLAPTAGQHARELTRSLSALRSTRVLRGRNGVLGANAAVFVLDLQLTPAGAHEGATRRVRRLLLGIVQRGRPLHAVLLVGPLSIVALRDRPVVPRHQNLPL